MAARRTRLPPRFAVGADAPAEWDVPGNLGVTPGRPPLVSEVPPGAVLPVERSARASWLPLAIAVALGSILILGRGSSR